MQGAGRLALGIDLGGTRIKMGLVSPQGQVVQRAVGLTAAERGSAAVVADLVAMARALTAGHRLEGVGVGAPGLIDAGAGLVTTAPNLGWQDVALGALLSERLGLACRVENDANAAVLGEHWCGAARGRSHVVMLTVGTGIGGGLVLDGRLYRGARGYAGELGHQQVDADGLKCSCGRRGCLETIASAAALERRAAQIAAGGGLAVFTQLRRSRSDASGYRLLVAAGQQGDADALALFAAAGAAIGRVLAGVVSLLNPEMIVIGGGGAAAGEMLLAPLRRALLRQAWGPPAAGIEVTAAQLGSDAGVIGAAALVWRRAGISRSRGGNSTEEKE